MAKSLKSLKTYNKELDINFDLIKECNKEIRNLRSKLKAANISCINSNDQNQKYKIELSINNYNTKLNSNLAKLDTLEDNVITLALRIEKLENADFMEAQGEI